MLGAIPQSGTLARPVGNGSPLPPPEAEGFSLIRARLRFFNIDRDLRTIVIASAEPGEGKTVIARHLADAAARLGSRVLLLEADLRHPTLAEQLGVHPGPGLAEVLIGSSPMHEAIQSVPVVAAPGE